MATSPLFGADRAARRPAGTSTEVLGPSDSSDSGSDLSGEPNLDADSDRSGTGERAEVGRDTLPRDAPDIAPDRVIDGEGSDDALVADTDDFALEDDVDDEDDADPSERDKSIDA